jgi:hypothetical protein
MRLALLRLLQVMFGDVEVHACAALFLMLPGRRRVGALAAPGSLLYMHNITTSCRLQWVKPALHAGVGCLFCEKHSSSAGVLPLFTWV